ncbi:MAG: Uma2 family endonuclease, partial [Bacteroidia bacterium]|nr:Uma2 family endonuclease [Bacteroidia bacterium]
MEPIKIDPCKRYSYADYYSWNDDKRYEIINGVIFDLSPAPSASHQTVS